MNAIARLFGVVCGLLSVTAALMGLLVGLSLSGGVMIIGLGACSLGALSAARGGRLRFAAVIGVTLLLIVIAVRIIAASQGSTTMVTLPRGQGSRWLGRLIEEQDGSLMVMRALLWLPRSFVRPTTAEREEVIPALREAYVAMRRSEGVSASPVLDTLAGRQRPGAFDTLVIEPRAQGSDRAVIFLHGFAGNLAIECWMMAEAARAIDALTLCPSTGFSGAWWDRDGARTLGAAIELAHARGAHHIYLAGLSNGGVGASLLAPRFATSLDGLILISGVAPRGATAGLPTLVVQGEDDRMASAVDAHAFAARTHADYAGFKGGHFVMAIRRAEVASAIGGWLKRNAKGMDMAAPVPSAGPIHKGIHNR